MNRYDILRQHIDVANGRGLEIGPLTNPIVTRQMGAIFYADHASTEELREKYRADPGVNENAIMSIDFVWGEKTLAEAVGSAAPFDYLVASHVLEHVPDLIGWLREVCAVLRPGGRISLCMPDRRFTFDVRRRDTDISEVVEAHLLGLRRPAVRAIFDHFYRFANVDCAAMWQGERGHDNPPFDARVAMDLARVGATTDTYLDTHCWVFSDASFVELMRNLLSLDLVDLCFVAVTPTPHNAFEFYVTLERPAEAANAEERIRRNLQSIPRISPNQPAIPAQHASQEERIHELEQELALLRSSTSWRLTAPLRKMRQSFLRRK